MAEKTASFSSRSTSDLRRSARSVARVAAEDLAPAGRGSLIRSVHADLLLDLAQEVLLAGGADEVRVLWR